MNKNICVFASSCNYLDESYYPVAAELGKLLAKNGFNMVYGGSSLGLMWACAEQVQEYGGKIFGVMPEKLYNMGSIENRIENIKKVTKNDLKEVHKKVFLTNSYFLKGMKTNGSN